MRILFIGDIVGRSGRAIVLQRLPDLVRDWKLDFVAANGENAAGGFGITETIYQELVDAGIDVITGGNHSWDQKEPLARFVRRIPSARFEPAAGAGTLCALAVETDDSTGLALRLSAVRLGGRLEQAKPQFWD